MRLRNIGGLIVIDFIDMSQSSNRNKLSRFLEKELKERDKYQSVTLKVSEFGLVQMTRKRSGKTLVDQLMHVCNSCKGLGHVKSTSTQSLEVLQSFKADVTRKNISGTLVLKVSPDVFTHLVDNEYKAILEIEKTLNIKIIIERDQKIKGSHFSITKAKQKK